MFRIPALGGHAHCSVSPRRTSQRRSHRPAPTKYSQPRRTLMKKICCLLVLSVIAFVMVLAPIAWAADVQGKIKSVDPTGHMVTLADGTQLTLPPTLKIEKQSLKPGANVKATYEEKDGQKVATAFMVMPSTPSR